MAQEITRIEPPPNRRLQLTAFGARDRWFFDSFCSASAAAEAQHVGRHLDGTSSHSRTRLTVMHSNAIVCWRDLKPPCRDEQRIQTPIYAGEICGKVIWSCPMHSNAIVCWRGLVGPIACGQASERLGVPSDLRQADLVLPVHRSIEQPPNRRVQLTPLRGPKIVAFLKADLGSVVISIHRRGAADAQHVRRQPLMPIPSFNVI